MENSAKTMTITYVVSLLVNVSIACAVDQVLNIKHFFGTEDVGVIIHISKSIKMTKEDVYFFWLLRQLKNVYINPVRMSTEWGHIWLAMNNNFIHALNHFGPFKYIMYLTSNELFLKYVPKDFIESVDVGFSMEKR